MTLTDERDLFGQQKLALKWNFTRLDKRTLVRGLQMLAAEMGRTSIGRLKMKVSQTDDPNTFPEQLVGGNHHIGTTRMADNPHNGVVDRNGRVHSVSNLFVAGSSVFPTAGANTPTLTIVAMALRLADHLKKETTLGELL